MWLCNVFDKTGITRDAPGDIEKTLYLCEFTGDAPRMPWQKRCERRRENRRRSFFASIALETAEWRTRPFSHNARKTASNCRFQGAKEPLGASRKSQQQTIEDGLAALYCSITDSGPDVERARRANGALQRAEIDPVTCVAWSLYSRSAHRGALRGVIQGVWAFPLLPSFIKKRQQSKGTFSSKQGDNVPLPYLCGFAGFSWVCSSEEPMGQKKIKKLIK